MDELIIVGGGGHGVSVFQAVNSLKRYNVTGFVDKRADAALARFGVKYLGTDDELDLIFRSNMKVVIGLGQKRSVHSRTEIAKKLEAKNANFPVIIAPSAFVSQYSTIGKGTVVLNQAMVNADCQIGNFNIVNSGAIIEHGVAINDHVHIAPGAIILGDVTIGAGSFIGAGAIIREGLRIGKKCIIAAGAFVNENVQDGQVARR